MTAPSATELPTAQPNVPANSRHPGPRAVPSVSSVLILPPGPIVDRHRRPPSAPPRAPAGRPATSRLPESSPDNRACSSLTPLPLSSRRPSVSFGGFGLRVCGKSFLKIPAAAAAPAALKAERGAVQLWSLRQFSDLKLPRICRTCRICPRLG